MENKVKNWYTAVSLKEACLLLTLFGRGGKADTTTLFPLFFSSFIGISFVLPVTYILK
jgi:hypothetical protein